MLEQNLIKPKAKIGLSFFINSLNKWRNDLKIKKSNHLNRLVTLSPLTEMATSFHTRNGAKLIQINETTQNFEYKVL